MPTIAAPERLNTTRTSVASRPSFSPPHGSASVHLDALRGLAAFSVVLCHWRDALFVNYPDLPSHSLLTTAVYYLCDFGHSWVMVFFVLSGYLVGGSVLRSRQNCQWSWRSYLLARLTRLYVVLIPALLLGGLLDWIGTHRIAAQSPEAAILYSGQSGMESLSYDVHLSLRPLVLLGNLAFQETRHVLPFGSNGPLWSLTHEFWYYLAFPLLLIALSEANRPWLRIACALLVLLMAAAAGRYVAILFLSWLMGVMIPFLPSLRSIGTRPLRMVIGAAGTLLAAGMVLATGSLSPGNPQHFPQIALTIGNWRPPIADLLLSLVVTVLIWTILNGASRPLPAAYQWLAKRAASTSYTLYLVHMPALIFLKATLRLPRTIPSWHAAIVGGAVLLAVIVYGQLVYELFEKNTDRLRNWLKPYVLTPRTNH